MESGQICLIVVGLVLVVGVNYGSAIDCYQCNSKYDVGCDDPLNHAKGPSYLESCDSNPRAEVLNVTFKYCRKIRQNVEEETRTVRQCASAARLECIDRTGTKDVKVTYCECEGDGCNSASSLFSLKVALVSAASALLALLAVHSS